MQSDEVTVRDVEMLKKALTNIGVSAPASVEELVFQYQSYARQVVQKVAEGYPFLIPASSEVTPRRGPGKGRPIRM